MKSWYDEIESKEIEKEMIRDADEKIWLSSQLSIMREKLNKDFATDKF